MVGMGRPIANLASRQLVVPLTEWALDLAMTMAIGLWKILELLH